MDTNDYKDSTNLELSNRAYAYYWCLQVALQKLGHSPSEIDRLMILARNRQLVTFEDNLRTAK